MCRGPGRELLGTVPDRRGEQQLPARGRPQAASRARRGASTGGTGLVQAALVGHPEVADLLNGVAPELDPQRVVLGGREHVQDAAADRYLTAVGHQLSPGIPDVHQAGEHFLQVGGVAGGQRYGHQLTQAACQWLQQPAHRGDDHFQRAGPGIARVGPGQPPQDREAAPGGVRPR